MCLNGCSFKLIFSILHYRIRHKKKKGNKKKERVGQRDSSLQLRKRLSGKKTKKTGSESKPLLQSHSPSERKDSSSISEHVDSDTSLD